MKTVNWYLALLIIVPFCTFADTEQPSVELLEFLADWSDDEQILLDISNEPPTSSEQEVDDE